MSAKRQWNKQFFYVLNFCQTVLCKISLTVWASDEWKARYANQILWACTRALDKDSRATAFHLAQEHHECHDRLSHRTAGGKRCSWEPIFLKAADFTIAVMYSKCCLDCFFSILWLTQRHCASLYASFPHFMPPPTVGGGGIMFSGPSVRPFTPILSDAISLYLVEGYQWIFIMWVGLAEQVFKVRGQRSRSRADQLIYNGAGIHDTFRQCGVKLHLHDASKADSHSRHSVASSIVDG